MCWQLLMTEILLSNILSPPGQFSSTHTAVLTPYSQTKPPKVTLPVELLHHKPIQTSLPLLSRVYKEEAREATRRYSILYTPPT